MFPAIFNNERIVQDISQLFVSNNSIVHYYYTVILFLHFLKNQVCSCITSSKKTLIIMKTVLWVAIHVYHHVIIN